MGNNFFTFMMGLNNEYQSHHCLICLITIYRNDLFSKFDPVFDNSLFFIKNNDKNKKSFFIKIDLHILSNSFI